MVLIRASQAKSNRIVPSQRPRGYTQRGHKGDYRWVPKTSGTYRLYQGDKIV